MSVLRMFIACSSLVAVVAMPAIGFSIKVASAQSEPLVMVISGEKSRSACEVQDRRTNDDNWGAQSLEGPPVACEGGVVYAVITPQSEMVAAVSRAEVAAESAEASDVRVVPVPDDPKQSRPPSWSKLMPFTNRLLAEPQLRRSVQLDSWNPMLWKVCTDTR